MDSEPEKTFEDHWAEAFKDASMAPPDQCWENIERELDKKHDRKPFLFLWRNKGIASGIAAMLLLTLGYVLYDNNKVSKTTSPAISMQTGKNEPAIKDQESAPGKSSQTLSEQPAAQPFAEKKETDVKSRGRASDLVIEARSGQGNTRITMENTTPSADLKSEPVVALSRESASTVPAIQQERKTLGEVKAVNGLAFEPYENSFITKRNKLSYELPATTEVLASNGSKTFWMGLNSGVSPFNPNYSASSFGQDAMMSANKVSNESFSYNATNGNSSASFVKPSSQPDNRIQNGRAINFGMSVGKKVSKRMGVESGFRYLKANSSLQTNVYSINDKTGDIQAYFQANYLNARTNNLSTIISLSENGNQHYEYLSIPMQLSYQIPLIKKIDLQVLGGVSGDLFLKSVLTGSNSGKNILTASNSIYKPLNISGLGGLRLNYAVGKNWEAVLGSFYQHSLNSGLKSGENLSYRPKMFGINYGLNYKF